MSRRTTHASAHPPIRPPAVDTIQPLRHLHRHRRRGYESRQRTLLLGREHQVEGGARRPGGHRVYGVQVGDHDDTQLLGGEDRQLGGIAAERGRVSHATPAVHRGHPEAQGEVRRAPRRIDARSRPHGRDRLRLEHLPAGTVPAGKERAD